MFIPNCGLWKISPVRVDRHKCYQQPCLWSSFVDYTCDGWCAVAWSMIHLSIVMLKPHYFTLFLDLLYNMLNSEHRMLFWLQQLSLYSCNTCTELCRHASKVWLLEKVMHNLFALAKCFRCKFMKQWRFQLTQSIMRVLVQQLILVLVILCFCSRWIDW